MPNEAELRKSLAKCSVWGGSCPDKNPNRTWGGPGVGARVLCAKNP